MNLLCLLLLLISNELNDGYYIDESDKACIERIDIIRDSDNKILAIDIYYDDEDEEFELIDTDEKAS